MSESTPSRKQWSDNVHRTCGCYGTPVTDGRRQQFLRRTEQRPYESYVYYLDSLYSMPYAFFIEDDEDDGQLRGKRFNGLRLRRLYLREGSIR